MQGSLQGPTRSDEESSRGSDDEVSGEGSNLGDSDEEELSVASRSKLAAGQGGGGRNDASGSRYGGPSGPGNYGKTGAGKRQVASDDEDDFVDDDEDDDDLSGGGGDDDDDDGNF